MQKNKQNLRITWETLRTVFLSPMYMAIALAVAGVVLVLSIWLPNLGLIWSVVISESMSFSAKVAFLWNSLGALGTNFSTFSATLTVLISILLGFNIALMVYYFRKRLAFQKASGASVAGMLAGLIGVGCASCGSIILSAFIGVGATAAFTATLPLAGQEFSLLAIAILGSTLYITAKKSADPFVCNITSEQ